MSDGTAQMVKVEGAEQIALCARLASSIWHECFAHILKPEQIDYMVEHIQSAQAMTSHIENDGYEYFLIYSDGQLAGYTAIQPKDGKLFLSKLYVDNAFRGRGLGKAGLAFAEAAGRKYGCSSIWLTVNRFNEQAIAVYRHSGYALVREQQVGIGGGFIMDDFVFEKQL